MQTYRGMGVSNNELPLYNIKYLDYIDNKDCVRGGNKSCITLQISVHTKTLIGAQKYGMPFFPYFKAVREHGRPLTRSKCFL